MRRLVILLLLVAFSSIVSSKKLTAEEDSERARICGRRPEWFHPKNVTGTVRALPEQAPWTVLLKFHDIRLNRTNTCTGSWISTRHIATASTCSYDPANSLPRSYTPCRGQDAIFTRNFTNIQIFNADGTLLPIRPSTVWALGECFFHVTNVQDYDLTIMELSEDVEFTETGSIWPICITGDRSLEKPGARFHTFYLNHVNSSTEALNYRSYKILLVPEKQPIFNVTSEGGSVPSKAELGGSSVVLDEGRIKLLAVGSNYFAPNTHVSVGYHAKDICTYTGICLSTFG